MLQDFSEPLICCYALGSSKSGIWNIALDLMDCRDPGPRQQTRTDSRIVMWEELIEANQAEGEEYGLGACLGAVCA